MLKPASRPRSTMDSIRVSEAPDTGSIPVEVTNYHFSRSPGNWQLKEKYLKKKQELKNLFSLQWLQNLA